jgi:pantoate--beta-alanine ligase
MLIYKHIKDIEKQLVTLKKAGKSIGFVPTMGALHKGHIALIKACKKGSDITVCSIFINPTQFNDKADFDKYPVTIDRDIELLSDAACDILFLPAVKEMYPAGFGNVGQLDFGPLAQVLEGEHRPGHFDGMAQIVEKLLRVVKPDKLYMGQKDYQQQLIVRQLIKKRKLATKLVTRPTLREDDGLAMSSRNVRLDKHSREVAVELSKTLESLKLKVQSLKANRVINVDELLKQALSDLAKFKEIEVEYLAICDADTLMPITTLSKKSKAVALVAARIGGVRLIDNVMLGE